MPQIIISKPEMLVNEVIHLDFLQNKGNYVHPFQKFYINFKHQESSHDPDYLFVFIIKFLDLLYFIEIQLCYQVLQYF